MPALTYIAEKIRLSLAYDTLTVYPKFPTLQMTIPVVTEECIRALEYTPDTTEIKHENIDSELQNLYYIRYVVSDDDDHRLYHLDNNKCDEKHRHINFSKSLSRDELSKILSTFVKHAYLTTHEKEDFLTQFDFRFILRRKALDLAIENPDQIALLEEDSTQSISSSYTQSLTPLPIPVFESKTLPGPSFSHTIPLFASSSSTADYGLIAKINNDTKNIITFLQTIDDVDVIIDLHQYLASEKFNYLREITPTSWRGTDAKGTVIPTTESWAMIEKTCALQVAIHIKRESDLFTQEVAERHASNLKTNYSFFSLNRESETQRYSPTFKVFKKGDADGFDERYEQHFKGLR